ncbi:hypothetical protein [Parafilimonas sp.]|uniref:hypothetical protein n=1 Tax=Parafilimonas sp. TaxID=1969739 RepID=UPI0039E2F3EF
MKRILIIDDDCFKEEESIISGFEGTGIELFLCDNKDEGLKYIKSKALFDCIVLDWFLEEDDSSLSQLVLKELEGTYFAPVLIYSAHSENFKQVKESGAITFPHNLICEVDKGNFTDIKIKVENWLTANTTAKLSNIYLKEIYSKIHATFWNLNNIPDGNIASAYKRIVSDNGNIDWTNDFIVNLLLQGIISDSGFRNEIANLISELGEQNPATTPEQRKMIVSKILYHQSHPTFLSCADIIKTTVGKQSCYGFITTPDCDLANPKTKYIEFIELIDHSKLSIGDKGFIANSIETNKSESHFYLPAIPIKGEELIDLVAIFKAKHHLQAKNNSGTLYPKAKAKIKYTDTFIFQNVDCSVEYICSLVNPYKAELLQKKNSHDSRVGIPGVYEYLKGG